MRTFDDALAVLLDGVTKFDLTESQAAVWRVALADIPPEALYAAAFQLLRESSYAPSIASWRERALFHVGQGKGHAVTPAEAWDEMRRNRKLYSPYNSHEKNGRIQWSSEVVRRAAEAVQWTDLSWTVEQLPTIRAQFERYVTQLAGKRDAIDAANETLELLPGVRQLLERSSAKALYGADYRDPVQSEHRMIEPEHQL